ncbi:cilia- and flagella-associated protein 65 isoform X2 [Xiphophorus couchianus]|uniref:cilia- and flagella-associated protein 65 isoform X1 n=1 Tax=Xiphophorus couchianus TaxID=32473 RepID=UPI0010171312|nr:cilia- and flagella-associated protein 65 isoform X1 [Xiphophorus couchianus]XP_027877735.1 cilia- and flagella-associated protein 65 isoform X2 [Xiphophorus couchianus]
MLAESRCPACLASAFCRWKRSSRETDVKEPQLPDIKQCQRKSHPQRSIFLGLETTLDLTWKDWVIEREYTKTLVISNIRNKLQKLHISAPETKFFSILNPEVVILSPGTSFSIPVTFKPLQKCGYKDCIQFQAIEGSFKVYLHAVLSNHTMKVPESVMLPLCAVEHYTLTSFPLKNISKVQMSFKWNSAAPFQLSPEQGRLKPGQQCVITVDFQPVEAQVYQKQVHCTYGEDGNKANSCCTVLLQGIGKYPYLQLRISNDKEETSHGDIELDFGSVAVGHSLSKQFEIFNPSPVSVWFSLSQLPGAVAIFGPHFSWDVTSEKIVPGGSVQVLVTYSPTVVDIVSVEYLSLNYRGSLSKSQVKLIGKCMGPELCLSSTVVDFGCVEEKGSAEQTVELLNSSPVQATYQWDIDCANSVFRVSPASGTVLPYSQIKVKVSYKPTHPMPHHRRVACLILLGEPLFLDLIGTCHTNLQEPVALTFEHLVEYKSTLCYMCNSSDTLLGVPLEEEGHSATAIPPAPMEKLNEIREEHVDSLFSPSFPFVSVEPSELLFNHKTRSFIAPSFAVSQCVTFKNHTKEKLSLMWTVIQDSPFCVTPSSFELAPLKSTTALVTYEPRQINALHGGELECFAYCKMPQEDPSSEQDLPCLPCCVTVRVISHSFQPGKDHFTPSCILKPHQVVFPPLSLISYRTVLLQNNGDQPLTFCLNYRTNSDLPRSVHMSPGCGFIQPGQHQILTIGAVPTLDSPTEGFNLPLQLNADEFTKELTVVSSLKKPCVSFENSNELHFTATAVGSKSQHSHSIKNLSSVPITFQWIISERDQNLICVEPDAGKLHPNESLVQTWTFSPLTEKAYTFKPTLSFQSDDFNKSQLIFRVNGTGAAGTIEAGKELLDMGESLVGSCRSFNIPIVNNCSCPISFHLSVQLEENPPDSEDNSALHLDFETGTIASHSTVLIGSTLRLDAQGWYRWAISYQITDGNGFGVCPPEKLCELRAKGVFPTLQVVDACSSGSVDRLCKQYLWKLFSLDSFNEHLLSTPCPAEITFKAPTKHRQNSVSSFPQVILDFNFGAGPLHSDPSDFMLMFWNPGSISVNWTFLFPEDQEMKLEDWAMTGQFSNKELQEMKVQDNQLFRVTPRSGTLLPGQKCPVHFCYSHDFIGIDRLPVLFKLSLGRVFLLNFQGVTLNRNEPYLHFASNHHVFKPVAIRDSSPPRQIYELYNGGAVTVHYEVDQVVLSQLQMENYDHPVLSCLSPQGEVLPGNKAMLEWIFSPLEAKMYHVDVPIHILEKDSVIINFEGRGMNALSTSTNISIEHSDAKTQEHRAQKGPFPGQVAWLSKDSVFIGDIPVCTKSSSIMFITSLSCTDTVHFVWEIPTQSNQQVVQIHPERGCLGPGECVMCILTFVSDFPTVYQLDLICQVTQNAALIHYHKALQCWEEEKKRQENEFTITDKIPSRTQRVLVDEILLAPPARKGAPLPKYKTLPPICGSKAVINLYDKNKRAQIRLQRESANIWRRPQMPQPALLHLSVTAHTYDVPDFYTHFPDRYLQLTRIKQRLINSSSTRRLAKLCPSTCGAERDIVVDILTPLYKDLLEDSAFVESLMVLASKPPIYEGQTSTSPSVTFPSSPQHSVQSNWTVDGEEAAVCLGKISQIQATAESKHVPSDLAEAVLLKTLQNLMMEAVTGELTFSAYSRSKIPTSFSVSRTSFAEGS